MKNLMDLNPEWINLRSQSGDGISMTCPKCIVEGVVHRLHLFFTHPLDGGEPSTAAYKWKRSGLFIPTLTLSPSIHFECGWSGWIENGIVFNSDEAPLTIIGETRVPGSDTKVVKPIALSPNQTIAICQEAIRRAKQLLKGPRPLTSEGNTPKIDA